MSAICGDLKLLIDLLKKRGATLITIDGAPGAGKTHLAQSVANELGWRVLGLDAYLRERINGEAFQNLVSPAFYHDLSAAERPFIVEGVMIRDVATTEGVAALSVYVKHVSEMGLWDYGFDIERGHPLEIPGLPPSQLDREVLDYHLRLQPHIKADVIFERGPLDG